MQIIGMITVCVSGLGLSLLLVRREELALRRVSALIRFFEFVRASVEHYSLSASEILARCDGELLFLCGYEEADGPESFSDMAEHCDIPDREAEEIFSEFAAGFGKRYRARQAAKCSEYIERLTVREKRLREELPARRKMIIGLGISLTLIMVILLM